MREEIRRTASEAILAGVIAAEEMVDLSVLVSPAVIHVAMTRICDRLGRDSPGARSRVHVLKVLARHWAKSNEALALLEKRQFEPKQIGMTPRNRDRLQQFDNPENLLALLTLPHRVFEKLSPIKEPSRAHAVQAMNAMAIELLIMTPVRRANLGALRLGHHLREIRGGRREEYGLMISGDETKNGQPINAALPVDTKRLLKTYLRRYRPLLAECDKQVLFPNPEGDARHLSNLSKGVCKLIRQETGLEMHMHLFRHLAVKLCLAELGGGGLEVASKVLGHRTTVTTQKVYAEFETRGAMNRYAELVQNCRGPLNVPRGGPRGRK